MAIDRDLGRRRDAPMPSPGRRGQAMRSPGTIDDRAMDIAPDGVPFNFYDSGRMDPPRRRFPDNMPPRFPMPSPMPTPTPMPPRFPGPMPPPSIPPGMGPFRQQPFPDQMPRGDREFQYFRTPREIMPGENPFPGLDEFMGQRPTMMPAAATIDPSDYRTILKLIEQGLDPEDYMNRGGIASLLE